MEMLSVTLALVVTLYGITKGCIFFFKVQGFSRLLQCARDSNFTYFKTFSPPITSCCLKVGVPGAAERADILQKQLSSVPCSATADELTRVADDAHGYVGADLAAVCKEAGKWS